MRCAPARAIAALDALYDEAATAIPHAVTARALVLAALVLLGLALRAPALQHAVGGDHEFRQAVIVSQSQSLTAGSPLAPFETWDAPPAIFALPFYEALGAALSTATRLEPTVAARALSLLCFVATLLALQSLLREAGCDRRRSVLCLLFYALSPLAVHYESVPLADDLGIALGAWSLAFLWRARRPDGAGPLAIGVGLGVLSTLLKSPIYAFFFGGLLIHWLLFEPDRSRTRRRQAWLAALFLGAAFAAEGARSLVVGASPDGAFAQDPRWYFGTLGDRFEPHHWWRIGKRVLLEYGSPLACLLALGGLRQALRGRDAGDRLALSFLLSALALVWVFFNVHRHHNYYQLPFLLPFCLLAARGLAGLARVWRGPAFAWSLALFLLLSALFALFHPIRGLAPARPAYAVLLAASVPGDGFVFFADYDSSPAPLLHAGRRGRKLVDRQALCASADRAPGRGPIHLFVAAGIDLAEACPGERAWQPLHAWPGVGRLYRLNREAAPAAAR